jgi:hypothetical protein
MPVKVVARRKPRPTNLLQMKPKPCAGSTTGAENPIPGGELKFTPMFANYQYSLTGAQQSAIQLWLRSVDEEAQQTLEWELLHDLTYTMDWTPNKPTFELAGEREIDRRAEDKPSGGAQ